MTTTEPTPAEALDQARAVVDAWQSALDWATDALAAAMAAPDLPDQAAERAAERVHGRELVQVCTEGLQAAQQAAQLAEEAARPANWAEIQRAEHNRRQWEIEQARRAVMKERNEALVAQQRAQAEEFDRRSGWANIARPPQG